MVGLLGMGVYGSFFIGKGSVVYEYVIEMCFVVLVLVNEGYVKVVIFIVKDDDFKVVRFFLVFLVLFLL